VKAVLVDILDKLYRKEITPQQALEKLEDFPYQDLSFAKVDHARELRRGTPEIIFGQGKTPEQLAKIAKAILKKGSNLLITRLSPENYRNIRTRLKVGLYHEQARCLTVIKTSPPGGKGRVAVISAGTSDVPVAEEAALTAEFLATPSTEYTTWAWPGCTGCWVIMTL